MAKVSFLLIICCLIATPLFADKSSTKIEAPDNVKKGSTITIKITVTHSGNNFFHYTNWVYVNINGKEVARWDYSSSDRPENEIFSKEIKYTVNEPITIEAEANCNLHGSKGKSVKKIEVQ